MTNAEIYPTPQSQFDSALKKPAWYMWGGLRFLHAHEIALLNKAAEKIVSLYHLPKPANFTIPTDPEVFYRFNEQAPDFCIETAQIKERVSTMTAPLLFFPYGEGAWQPYVITQIPKRGGEELQVTEWTGTSGPQSMSLASVRGQSILHYESWERALQFELLTQFAVQQDGSYELRGVQFPVQMYDACMRYALEQLNIPIYEQK